MTTQKCKLCVKIFSSYKTLLEHVIEEHLSALDSISCMFCDKKLANFDDMLHHIELAHRGINSEILANATLARDTKKQLGNYIDADQKGSSVECNFCFDMFSSLEKLNEHGIKEHNSEIHPEFIDKMRDTIGTENEQPICERCNRKFLGVVFTRIDNKIQNICFNCYADYFGTNALTRLTIGTNDDMLAKLRIPLK